MIKKLRCVRLLATCSIVERGGQPREPKNFQLHPPPRSNEDYTAGYYVIQTKPKSSRWRSRASPAERWTRSRRGRTCWTPTWASAPAFPVTSRSARRWTRGSRSCHPSLRRTCETRARQTWKHRRTEKSFLVTEQKIFNKKQWFFLLFMILSWFNILFSHGLHRPMNRG